MGDLEPGPPSAPEPDHWMPNTPDPKTLSFRAIKIGA